VELRPRDGKMISSMRLTYNGGDGALAFDGANIWAAGYSGDFVSKL
jgi:hypothetical protein